jgi:hypothetical protein
MAIARMVMSAAAGFRLACVCLLGSLHPTTPRLRPLETYTL